MSVAAVHKAMSVYQFVYDTSRSAMAERPREIGDFKAVGHFDAQF